MKDDTRAAIAYIAGRLILDKDADAVYDQVKADYVSISGDIHKRPLLFYDYETSSHFLGKGSDNRYRFFDYADNHHISLTIDGRKFEGFDYGQEAHFRGEVEDNEEEIEIYDYETTMHYQYRL